MSRTAGGGTITLQSWRSGRKAWLLGAAVAAAGLALAPQAHALPVSVGISGSLTGPITTINSGDGVAGVIGYNAGGTAFTVNNISAQGTPPSPEPELFSNSIDTSTAGSGVLYVWITETGITSPGGTLGFASSFTANELTGGVTGVQMESFVSQSDDAYAMTTPLSAAAFTGIGTDVGSAAASLTGSYSETELYIITATGPGTANLTMEIDPIPEPASFALLGIGLVGLVPFSLRRRGIG